MPVEEILRERKEREEKALREKEFSSRWPVHIPSKPGLWQDWAIKERQADLDTDERLRRERSAEARTGHQQNPHVPCPPGFVRLPFWRGGNCVRAGSGGISLALGAVVAGLVLVIALDR